MTLSKRVLFLKRDTKGRNTMRYAHRFSQPVAPPKVQTQHTYHTHEFSHQPEAIPYLPSFAAALGHGRVVGPKGPRGRLFLPSQQTLLYSSVE